MDSGFAFVDFIHTVVGANMPRTGFYVHAQNSMHHATTMYRCEDFTNEI